MPYGSVPVFLAIFLLFCIRSFISRQAVCDFLHNLKKIADAKQALNLISASIIH